VQPSCRPTITVRREASSERVLLVAVDGKSNPQPRQRMVTVGLPELPVEPLGKHGKSRAQLALESDDALRTRLLP